MSLHLLMEGGHREEVRFQHSRVSEVVQRRTDKAASNDFISVPIRNIQRVYGCASIRVMAIRRTEL